MEKRWLLLLLNVWERNVEAHELLPHVHLVDSLLKKWINGTHQGNIHPYHLPYYLDEFAFRFNRRFSSYRGKLFYRLIQQSLACQPKTYKDITKISSPVNKDLLAQLIEDVNSKQCSLWALKKVKTIEPVIEKCVRELSKLEPLKYIKITPNSILASNEVEGNVIKNPVTKPFHNSAIGIHLVYDFRFKMLEFCEINSATKGWGEKMVEAVLKHLPTDWQPALVFDYSSGFWEKMQVKYNHLKWMLI